MTEYPIHAIAAHYRPHTTQEMLDLQESIEKGWDDSFPIILLTTDNVTEIIDGTGRQKAAGRAGVEPTYRQFLGTLEEAEAFVERANYARRHMTVAELTALRKARISRVADARRNGVSLSDIAGTEDVSVAQVRRDLEESNDEVNSVMPGGGITENEPPKTEGKDGKKYPAKKKRKPKKAEEDAESGESEQADAPPAPAKDELDELIPPGLASVFDRVADFKEIVNQLNAINRKLKELSESPAGGCMRLQNAQIDLKNLKETVRFDTPFCVCPMCKGNAKTRKANCACKQRGWLVEVQYKALPQEYRQ